MNKRSTATFTLTRCGVLAAISIILFYIEIPIFGPYKLDFSTLPAILAGFAMGPVQGVIIVLIKNLIHMLSSRTGLVGELADFIMSCAYVIFASLLYRRFRSRKGALISMLIGTAAMTVAALFVNKFILFPLYGFTDAAVVGMCSSLWSYIDNINKFIVVITMPFNLLKGLSLSVVTYLLYKRISPLLHSK